MSTQKHVQKEMRRLLRCMDFTSRHPALGKPGREGRMLAEIYQQLGRAWEMLALQCRHRAGWRRLKEGGHACRMCGTLKGAKENWLLLPCHKPKVIGRMTRPTSERVLPSRKVATVVKDAVTFHGARLSVEVLNPHKSRLLRSREITIAADRLVELREGDVVCGLDDHMLRIHIGARSRGAEPPFSDLLYELPRRLLKSLPVMVETDRRGRFLGLIIFRPQPAASAAKARPRGGKRQKRRDDDSGKG